MPDEDPTNDEYTKFLTKPENAMLQCLPSRIQALKVMGILDVLSTHSTDEEYIADKMEASWEDSPAIKGDTVSGVIGVGYDRATDPSFTGDPGTSKGKEVLGDYI
ncbi:hypothetical protein Sjap_025346 [Stephania japonica]|uniref:Lipoxygenase domain-containing protein n=1 Tax=Stephania japonica TaxID=461633 RepID=A0AAP0E452_9MAGN